MLVETAPVVKNVEPDRALIAVRVLELAPQNLRLRVQTQGTVEPRTESELLPEVSGRVVWVSPALVAGGFFDDGEPLLRIERRRYEMAVAGAKAAVSRAASEVEFAADELVRQESLSARDVASAALLSEARRRNGVERAKLAEAQIALEQAEWDLERTEILAPFEGRVRSERVDVGQVATPGVSVATLYATDYAEIRLPISDHQLAFLDVPGFSKRGGVQRPAVHLRARFAGSEHTWHGSVVRTEGEIDQKSRMVHVVARVEDPYAALPGNEDRPPLAVGLFVRAEVEGVVVEDVFVIPRYAMRDEDHILVVDAQDRLRVREVEVVRVDGESAVIRGSLGRGERLCVSPVQVVIDGMRVAPVSDDDAPVHEVHS